MAVCTLNMNRTWLRCQSSTSQDDSDDSDLDIKRDILEGMTQVVNYASHCSSTNTTESFTTSPPISTASVTISRNSDVHEHKLRRRTGEGAKSRLLMPDLMENSETESAKNSGGSMESEAEPSATNVVESSLILPPPPSGDGPFPSLPDVFLQKLELYSGFREKMESLSEREIEIKFNSLCLAFKTDRFTLTSRLELHQRQRDVAEKNVNDEISALKESLNVLSQICSDEETRELVKRLHHHLEVLSQSTIRMLSRAEVYGAVQQEERTNHAIEAMLMHVENLKRVNEKAVTEAEEFKRILAENNLLSEEGSEVEDGRRTTRTYSASSVALGKPNSRRRASIAALPRSSTEKMDGKMKFASFVANAASRNAVCSIGGRRCSLLPSVRPFINSDRIIVSDKIKKTSDHFQLINNNNNVNENHHQHHQESIEQDLVTQGKTSQQQSSVVLTDIKSDSSSSKKIIPNEDNVPVVSPPSTSHGNAQIVRTESSEICAEKRSMPLYSAEDSFENGSVCSEGSFHQGSSWSPFKFVPNSYATDASEQEDEDDADIDETTSVPCSQSSSVLQYSPYGRAMDLIEHWVYDSTQIIYSVRYALGGILLLAALFSLLFTFVPASTTASLCRSHKWHSIEEMLRSYVTVHHKGRPPL